MRLAITLAAVAAAVGAAPAGAAPEPARIAEVAVDTGGSETLLDVAFPDARHGFAVGENGTILATADGGTSWARQRSGIEVSAEEIASRTPGQRAQKQPVALFGVWFATARQGWAVGTDTILSTSDAGATWASLPVPTISSIPGEGPGRLGEPQRPANWGFRAVRFSDEQRGVVVGTSGTVLTTDNGGRSWAWKGDRRFGNLDEVSFADGSSWRATGETGGGVGKLSVNIVSADGGATWEVQEAAGVGDDVGRSGFGGIATPTATRAYVAGSGGRIFVTVDGGHRWSVQRRDTTERFSGIAFVSPERGVAVGATDFSGSQRSSLVATEDGGETWVGKLVEGVILWDVAFASPTTAYAVGCAEYVPSDQAVSVVQADDGAVTPVQPCRKTQLVRISFAGEPPGSAGGGGGVPWVLVAGGLGVGLVTVAVLAGRSRSRGGRNR